MKKLCSPPGAAVPSRFCRFSQAGFSSFPPSGRTRQKKLYFSIRVWYTPSNRFRPPWGVEPLSYGVRRPAGRFLIGRAQDGAGCGAGASPPTARQGRAGGGPARAAQKRGAAAGRRRVTTRGIAPRILLHPAFSAIYIGDHRRGPPGPGLYFLAQKRSVRAVVSSAGGVKRGRETKTAKRSVSSPSRSEAALREQARRDNNMKEALRRREQAKRDNNMEKE